MAGLACIVGVAISLRQTDPGVMPVTKQGSRAVEEPAPSTTKPKPSDFDSYTVAPNLPRYIFIDKIGVRAIVKPLGLTPSGNVRAPSNIYETGWYNASSRPGQPGAALIDGHLSKWTKPQGVFTNLDKLTVGDTLVVERGDGKKLTYKVSKTKAYDADKVDMPAALSPVNSKVPGLNLITCTGQPIKDKHEFNQRLVIFSELQG